MREASHPMSIGDEKAKKETPEGKTAGRNGTRVANQGVEVYPPNSTTQGIADLNLNTSHEDEDEALGQTIPILQRRSFPN